jgi:hypothetical protein
MGACDSEAARKGPPYKRGRTASYGAGLPCAARRRLVLNSAGYAKSNRLFVINFDPANGALSIDDRFRDPGSTRAGIDLTRAGRTVFRQARSARHRVLQMRITARA